MWIALQIIDDNITGRNECGLDVHCDEVHNMFSYSNWLSNQTEINEK